MYIEYGSYQHAPGEANLINFSVRPRRSGRQFKVAVAVEAHVAGEIKATAGEDQYDVNTKLEALMTALKFDFQDFGLRHSNGTKTAHYLNNNDDLNITGNQVVHQVFPSNHNGEFSTGRDFAYAVRAEYRASETSLIAYQESIEHIGTTGPRVNWYENRYHAPFYRVDSLNSLQTIIQSGYAITLDAYLLPPDPVMPAPFYLQHLTRIRRTGPARMPQGFEGYHISWSYHFKTPAVFPVLPNQR